MAASLAAFKGVTSVVDLSAWWCEHESGDHVTLLAQLGDGGSSKAFGLLASLVSAVCSRLAGGEEGENGAQPAPLSPKSAQLSQEQCVATLRAAAGLCLAYTDKWEAGGGAGTTGTGPGAGSRKAAGAAAATAASVLACLEALHGSLLVLPRDGTRDTAAALAAVQRACERAYLAGLPGAITCTPLLVMLLLSELQDPAGPTAAALRRLYALRAALHGVDLEDPQSATMQELLLRGFLTPGVLRSDTGRKFLAHTMALSDAMALRAHSAVRSAFPLASARWAEWYADIYLRAWSLASAGGAGEEEGSAAAAAAAAAPAVTALTIETRCIQDLLHRGLHAALPAVFSSVRELTSRLIGSRKTGRKDVGAMLARVYAPILWRALDSPNTAVRRNAATLFRDAFPLAASPSASAGSGEDACSHSEQVRRLTALADDANPAIRELGVGFVAEALARHWGSFPALARSRLIERLAARASDASAPGVRLTAIKGLSLLLVTVPASHAPLTASQALLQVAVHLHDAEPKVRGAACELLGRIEAYKGSFPGGALGVLGERGGEQLLARLVLEGEASSSSSAGSTSATSSSTAPGCAEVCARLLLPSLFPSPTTSKASAKLIAQSLVLYEKGTLALLAWCVRFPALVPSSLLPPTAAALLRTAQKLVAAGVEEVRVAAAAAAAAPAAAAVAVAEEVEEEEEDEEGGKGAARKRVGRPGAKKRSASRGKGRAAVKPSAGAAAAAVAREEAAEAAAAAAAAAPPPEAQQLTSLPMALCFLKGAIALCGGVKGMASLAGLGEAEEEEEEQEGGSSSSSSSSSAAAARKAAPSAAASASLREALAAGQLEGMLQALAPVSALTAAAAAAASPSIAAAVTGLTQCLLELLPHAASAAAASASAAAAAAAEEGAATGAGAGAAGSSDLTASLWARLTPDTLHCSSTPPLLQALCARTPSGTGGVLMALLGALEAHTAHLSSALASHSTASTAALPSPAPPIHPASAPGALALLLCAVVRGGGEGVTPEAAVAALTLPGCATAEAKEALISRAMGALVKGMALLPAALGAGAACTGAAAAAAAQATACTSAWCQLTSAQVCRWGLLGRPGDAACVGETNLRDIVGWLMGRLLPAWQAAAAAEPPAPAAAAAFTLASTVTALAAELSLCSLALTPSLALYASLATSSTSPTAVHPFTAAAYAAASPASPLPAALFTLGARLIGAACEGLCPGDAPTLPAPQHPRLLAALTAHCTAAAACPALTPQLQGLAGGLVDAVARLRVAPEAASACLSALLQALLPAGREELGGLLGRVCAARCSRAGAWASLCLAELLAQRVREGEEEREEGGEGVLLQQACGLLVALAPELLAAASRGKGKAAAAAAASAAAAAATPLEVLQRAVESEAVAAVVAELQGGAEVLEALRS